MAKIPISLIIDDPAPGVSVYHSHHKTGFTKDERPVLEYVPNTVLFEFCDIIERYGIRGKYSVVPMPGNRGDIMNGVSGVPQQQMQEWLDTVKKRVVPRFAICPEMLTHNKAVDLNTHEALDLNERDWASTQDRSTLTPYISRAFFLLKKAGFQSCGVTSPWDFGIEVEDEYAAAISQAVWDVFEEPNAWYFLRSLRNVPNAKPWVALDCANRCVVSIPATCTDHFWQTIDTTRCDDTYINHIADQLISHDGKDGEIIRILETGGWPILITHWQSLVSNGLCTGLHALDEVGRRISALLSDRVEWMDFSEIMKLVLRDKQAFPKPMF